MRHHRHLRWMDEYHSLPRVLRAFVKIVVADLSKQLHQIVSVRARARIEYAVTPRTEVYSGLRGGAIVARLVSTVRLLVSNNVPIGGTILALAVCAMLELCTRHGFSVGVCVLDVVDVVVNGLAGLTVSGSTLLLAAAFLRRHAWTWGSKA